MRERFVAAAWRLGNTVGYDGLKIRTIAEDVGVSAALIYSYFDDKASLMDELRTLGATRFDEMLAEQPSHGDGALEAACEVYLRYMREHAWLHMDGAGLAPDSRHVSSFVRHVAGLLDDEGLGRDEAAMHLWIGVQGLLAASQCSPQIAESTSARQHLRLLIEAVRRPSSIEHDGATVDHMGANESAAVL